MEKIKIRISDKSYRHRVKTRTDALAVSMKVGFETVKKHVTLSLSLMGGILIVLFTIIGCSDVPYYRSNTIS